MLSWIPLSLAFCSMVYELILAQYLSLFFGGTIINFSLCISLFLFSMGMGSFWSEKIPADSKIKSLSKIEALLSLMGLLSVLYIYLLGTLSLHTGSSFIKAIMYILCFLPIAGIGFFSGFEVPLLMGSYDTEKKKFAVLAMDYMGSFLAAILYSLILIPRLGLIQSLLITVCINCIVFIYLEFHSAEKGRKLLSLAILYMALLIAGVFYSLEIETLARVWMVS